MLAPDGRPQIYFSGLSLKIVSTATIHMTNSVGVDGVHNRQSPASTVPEVAYV
jgi:hypothetical protein